MIRKSRNLGLVYGGYLYDGGAELLTGKNLLAIKSALTAVAAQKSVQIDLNLDTGAFHCDGGLESTARKNLQKILAALVALGGDPAKLPAVGEVDFSGGKPASMWSALVAIDAVAGEIGATAPGGGEGSNPGGGDGGNPGGGEGGGSGDLTAAGDWTSGRGVAHGYMIDSQIMGPGIPYWMAYDGIYGTVENGSKRDGDISVVMAMTATPEDFRVAVNFGEYGRTVAASMSGINIEAYYAGEKLAEGLTDATGRWVKTIPTFPNVTEDVPLVVVIHGPSDFIVGADHVPSKGDWRYGPGVIENIIMTGVSYDESSTSYGFSQFQGKQFPTNGRIADYCLQVFSAEVFAPGTGYNNRMTMYFGDTFAGPQSYKTTMGGRSVAIKYQGNTIWQGVLDENAHAFWEFDTLPFPDGAALTLEIGGL